MLHISFLFNAYSIIKLFSFSTTFVERVSGLGEDFAFNYISPTIYKLFTYIGMLFQSNEYNQLIVFYRLEYI